MWLGPPKICNEYSIPRQITSLLKKSNWGGGKKFRRRLGKANHLDTQLGEICGFQVRFLEREQEEYQENGNS